MSDRKKLGKVRALRICRELWIWLFENPDDPKENWPGWERLNTPYCYCHCPCCQYVRERNGKELVCNDCPLRPLWRYRKTPNSTPCENPRSAYRKWLMANKFSRMGEEKSKGKTAALQIVRGCEKALRKAGAKVTSYRRKR